jgi:hypothetical protein
VLDGAVAEPILDGPRVMPFIGKGIAAGVPQHGSSSASASAPASRSRFTPTWIDGIWRKRPAFRLSFQISIGSDKCRRVTFYRSIN